jgi:hypothetical protein
MLEAHSQAASWENERASRTAINKTGFHNILFRCGPLRFGCVNMQP